MTKRRHSSILCVASGIAVATLGCSGSGNADSRPTAPDQKPDTTVPPVPGLSVTVLPDTLQSAVVAGQAVFFSLKFTNGSPGDCDLVAELPAGAKLQKSIGCSTLTLTPPDSAHRLATSPTQISVRVTFPSPDGKPVSKNLAVSIRNPRDPQLGPINPLTFQAYGDIELGSAVAPIYVGVVDGSCAKSFFTDSSLKGRSGSIPTKLAQPSSECSKLQPIPGNVMPDQGTTMKLRVVVSGIEPGSRDTTYDIPFGFHNPTMPKTFVAWPDTWPANLVLGLTGSVIFRSNTVIVQNDGPVKSLGTMVSGALLPQMPRCIYVSGVECRWSVAYSGKLLPLGQKIDICVRNPGEVGYCQPAITVVAPVDSADSVKWIKGELPVRPSNLDAGERKSLLDRWHRDSVSALSANGYTFTTRALAQHPPHL